jgi:uncharacterized protein YndB with AHSA1/START domain
MRTIHHVLDVAAEPAVVYQALTEEKDLSHWWTTKVTAASTASTIGGNIVFTFAGEFNPVMTITSLEPATLVEWQCTDGVQQWAGDTFRFELDARTVDGSPQTRVRFWQQYATELSDDEYGSYNFNWGYYLESLRLLCTEGTGKPFDAGP